jgi:outer membrane protein assembly factor BamA
LILFFSSSLYAQEQAVRIIENADTVYVIRIIEFDVDGITRPYALIYHGEFKEGERIIGKDNLDRYLARKQQLLLNERVLEDVRIEYFLGNREEDGALPVTLYVHVKDTWNLIILPYPKYDSNEGFSLTLKARDYNFLGTMSALKMDLGYSQENGDHAIGFSVESGTHFQAGGLNWNLVFNNFFSYTFEDSLFYQNVTGLSLELPWRFTTFTVGINQYLTINEENSAENKEIYGLADRYYGPYGSTEPYVSWKIPFGVEIGNFGELAYTPRISGRVNILTGVWTNPESRLPASAIPLVSAVLTG